MEALEEEGERKRDAWESEGKRVRWALEIASPSVSGDAGKG